MEPISEKEEDQSHKSLPKTKSQTWRAYISDIQLKIQLIFYRISLFFSVDEKTKSKLWYKIFHEIFISSSMPKSQAYLYEQGFTKKSPFWFTLLSIDVVLRGISQVFLCNHPLCGVLICIGLGLSSYKLPLFALLGSAVCSFSAVSIARPPKEDILAGLCGYDGALVGCACLSNIASFQSVGSTVLLSFLAGIVHVACANLMKIWQLPCFTFAFNIVTIMILFSIKGDTVGIRFADASTKTYSHDYTDMSVMFAVDATIKGVGQFMFADTTIGSALVIAGIAMCSRKGALIAMLGSIVGWVISFYVLDVSNKINVRNGLYGYNCAGTCCVLAGGIFYKASDGAVLVGVTGASLAALLTVGIQGALDGLPVLTFPFILSAWIIMLSRSKWLDSADGILKPLMRRISSRQISNRPLKIPFLDYYPRLASKDSKRDETISRINSTGILQRMKSSSASLFQTPLNRSRNVSKIAACDVEEGNFDGKETDIPLYSTSSTKNRGSFKASFKDVSRAVVEAQREIRYEQVEAIAQVYEFEESEIEDNS